MADTVKTAANGSQTEADLLQDKNQGRGLYKTGKMVQRGPAVWD